MYPLAGWLGAGAGLRADFTVLGLIAAAAVVGATHLWPRSDLGMPVDIDAAPDDDPWP
jgi:predicted MFS family arabinose efflux permease